MGEGMFAPQLLRNHRVLPPTNTHIVGSPLKKAVQMLVGKKVTNVYHGV